MKISSIAGNGLIKENPVFVLLLGMCPTLGVTTSAFNGPASARPGRTKNHVKPRYFIN